MTKFKKRNQGFTISEILMGIAIFAVIAIIFATFLRKTNVEVDAVMNRSQADEAVHMLLTSLAQDLKSARRNTFVLSGSTDSCEFIRFIVNEDDKTSDMMRMEKVAYSLDQSSKQVTRTATPVELLHDSSQDLSVHSPFAAKPASATLASVSGVLKQAGYEVQETGPPVTTEFENISAFTLVPKPLDGFQGHTQAVGIDITAEIEGRQGLNVQDASSQMVIYIRDEAYFAEQPTWNQNALYESKFIQVSQGAPQLIDFKDITEMLRWITDTKAKLGETVDKLKKDIYNNATAYIGNKLQGETDALRRKFTPELGNIIRRTNNEFAKTIAEKYKDEKHRALGAMYLKDHLHTTTLAHEVHNKLIGGNLSYQDVGNFYKKYEDFGTVFNRNRFGDGYQTFSVTELKIPKIDPDDIDWFLDRPQRPDGESDAARWNAIKTDMDRVKTQLHSQLDSEAKVRKYLDDYNQTLTRNFSDRMLTEVRTTVLGMGIEQVVGQFAETAINAAMGDTGMGGVLEQAETTGDVPSEVVSGVKDFQKELTSRVIKIVVPYVAKVITEEVVKGKIGELAGISSDATDSLDQNKDKVRDENKSDFGDAASAISNTKDFLTNTVSGLSYEILCGKTYNVDTKQYTNVVGAINYLEETYNKANMPPPEIDKKSFTTI